MSGIKDFSTAGMEAGASLAAWRDYMAEIYYKLDIVPTDGGRIRGALSEVDVASICVSRFNADAQKVIRRKEAARLDGSENFVFIFPLKGKLAYRQRNNEGCIDPGDVVILNSAEYYAVDVPDDSANVTLKIPRELLSERLKWLDSCCARSNIANPRIVPIVSTMAAQLLSSTEDGNAVRLQGIVFDLIAMMVETSNGTYRGQRYASCLGDHLFEDVQAFIKRNFCKLDLTIADAAAACKVSERYINKVFKDRGTTFCRALMEVRLAEASRLLQTAKGAPSLQIGQIAFLCGFGSQAHFAVRYKERYGYSPREKRFL